MIRLFQILFNKRTAKKYGWLPSWFGALKFDNYLVSRILEFQRDHDLKEDGLVGELTYRRAFTTKEAFLGSQGRILCNGEMIPISWDKVKIDLIKPGCYKEVSSERKPTMIVTHWDVCLSAESCKRILEKRGISTHFCIDNDGTIIQFADCNNIAWHAGIRKVNNLSIGVDLSNAFYTKYQGTYVKRGYGERPVLTDSHCHGRILKPHLGFYPAQKKAYSALVLSLAKHYDIMLQCPLDDAGNLITTVHENAKNAKYNGVVCHYHLTRNKIDVAGLELDEIVDQLNEHPIGSRN